MKLPALLVAALLTLGSVAPVRAEHPAAGAEEFSLSPGLLDLLRAEMRELQGAVQAVGEALPAGDWTRIASTGEKMHGSYILTQQLTAAQREELAGLPERFRRLDEEFHARAEKLAHAASARDAELTAYYFSGLLEDCAVCHAAYAGQRFPGFAGGKAEVHHQH